MLLRHWQTMINKQTLTQCDISRSLSLSLSLLIPLGCLSSSSRGESSRTEHDRNTVKADGFMSQSFRPIFHRGSEFLRRCEDWKYEMSLFPTISELHRRRLHYCGRRCQTFVTSHQSITHTAPVIQLSGTKSASILFNKTTYNTTLNQRSVILQFEASSLVKIDWQ